MEAKILLVEDDMDIMEIMSLYLQKNEFTIVHAVDGKSAIQLFEQANPDLVLMDIVLPDIEGTEILRHIRDTSSIPVILMSCKKESQDIVEGLELGADDYITKPFDPGVVVARVKSQLRRNGGGGKQSPLVWKDDRLEIDQAALQVRVDGQPIHLYAKELQLLLLLAASPGQVFHVDQLFEQIWGWDNSSDSRTVMVHIRNLRKKIEKEPDNPRYIITVRGFGYKFSGSRKESLGRDS